MLVEGAGSPAEINLRAGDIANMGFARAADVPVVLVGDIDRGGVIAQLVGTRAVLDPADAAMIRGFLINKFRGDPSLFDDGYRLIADAHRLARLRRRSLVRRAPAACRPRTPLDLVRRPHARRASASSARALPRIANFDDLDPLRLEPGVGST